MDKPEMAEEKLEAEDQTVAQMAKLTKDNETLRKALLDNGFRITENGAEKVEAKEEAVAETLEVNGVAVNLSALPQEQADALKAMVAKSQDEALTAKATAMFPNMEPSAAKEFASMDLSESALRVLKSVNATYGSLMEEVGETASESMATAADKLESMIQAHMTEHNVKKPKATAAVLATDEGRSLYNQYKKEV